MRPRREFARPADPAGRFALMPLRTGRITTGTLDKWEAEMLARVQERLGMPTLVVPVEKREGKK